MKYTLPESQWGHALVSTLRDAKRGDQIEVSLDQREIAEETLDTPEFREKGVTLVFA